MVEVVTETFDRAWWRTYAATLAARFDQETHSRAGRARGHARRGTSMSKPFAIVTGASSGIGLELAAICAQEGFDLLVAADRPEIQSAADRFRGLGADVTAVETDLATTDGVDRLWAAAAGRPVDALLANAGHGLGRAFLDQDFADVRHVIDTNVTGTVYLVQLVGRAMRSRGQGRILLTGSIAGFMPGTYQAVYNGTKAFVDSFSFALRAELKDTGVTVTCLMPGATETDFFERADMLDTKVGQGKKDDPADVARVGFDAMMRGDGDVVSGWKNKLQSAIANVTPAGDPGRTASAHGRARVCQEGQRLGLQCDGAIGDSQRNDARQRRRGSGRGPGRRDGALADRRHQRSGVRRFRTAGRAGGIDGRTTRAAQASRHRRRRADDLHQR